MRYRRLGPSGLFVSELCLGTMTFGGSEGMWGQIGQLGQTEVDGLVGSALEAGINFIDTANVYAGGESERLLGQSLKNLAVPREDVVIATKVLGPMGAGVNARGASRYHIMEQCKASLARLQLDHIDLYQIHGFDPATPIVETLEALDTLVRQGHVRYLGLSNWAAWQIVRAVGIAEARRLAPILSLQAYYTLAGRDLEREIVPMLKETGIGLMVWSPLAGGFLSGKYDREGKAADGRRASFDFPPIDKDRAHDAIEAMRGMAEARGCSVAQIALAWLLHQEVVTSVIIGAKRADQLTDNIGATKVELSADELARLDAVTRLPAEYPGWMLERQGEYRSQS
ncbi:aldo/keto reductase [Rhodovulum sulfidophilum]|uniref:Aldo/keto reductase n=1 Tax=Rhodovulum visakhapatnamense TaxID=364297 RepID=A0ABS1RKI1_9RHOB|nr:aldo/keto reductase [Rhodovulum visakhapatnamense]MBL3571470.1 aldo/keto reductase [Rhodovulum visakhapatnamense]MBL3579629.1 aldo/keto reductase [Rhodovulum visakhapatnamense]OLS45993.1 aldo/keto reductase [Rhodovulum sulfidophilum]